MGGDEDGAKEGEGEGEGEGEHGRKGVWSLSKRSAAGRRTPRPLVLHLISREILPCQDSRTRHISSRVSLTILLVTIRLASLPLPPPSRITRMHASLTTSVTHLHLRLRLEVPKRPTTEIRFFEPVHTHKPVFSTRCVGPSLRMYRERVDGTAAPRSVYSERRAWRAKYILQMALNTANLFLEQLVEKSGLEFTRSLRGGCYIHRILTSTENDLGRILLSKMTYPTGVWNTYVWSIGGDDRTVNRGLSGIDLHNLKRFNVPQLRVTPQSATALQSLRFPLTLAVLSLLAVMK